MYVLLLGKSFALCESMPLIFGAHVLFQREYLGRRRARRLRDRLRTGVSTLSFKLINGEVSREWHPQFAHVEMGYFCFFLRRSHSRNGRSRIDSSFPSAFGHLPHV
jgi:hypothetical protein